MSSDTTMTKDDLVDIIDVLMMITKQEGATKQVAKDIEYYVHKLVELTTSGKETINV